VIVNLGGNELIVLSVNVPAAGLKNLTLNGGPGFNLLVGRPFPPGVGLTLNNITSEDQDPDDMFIEELFEMRLGRLADTEGLAFWKQVLHGPLGRLAVVQGIEESAEARTQLVHTWYQRFLGRDAMGGEEQGWVNMLLHGASEEAVLSGILGSPEFFQRAQTLFNTGNANANFISALDLLLLNRDADDNGLNFFSNALATMNTQQVAMIFLQSGEFRSDTVGEFFQNLLHRGSDDQGLAHWVDSRLDLTQIREGFEAADEFFANG
jgi:hypothetical protein